jgi:hypothetical protein
LKMIVGVVGLSRKCHQCGGETLIRKNLYYYIDYGS